MKQRGDGEDLRLGEGLRQVRKERRISLEQLAAGTELSVGFLSQFECGKANISVENLKKITDFLDIDMVRLFEVNGGRKLGTITRKGEGMPFTVEESTAYCEALVRKSSANLQATLYVNPPGEGRKVPMAHVGDELVYVIRGEALFTLNDQEYLLKEGDLMHYRSEALHSWVNPGKWECVLLIVNSPPNW
ncbi:MAG: XRE family transcriptional regulator [Deltaproteobacteria bacterium]|nr:XRE family transcriptional regulator [Deltaproteobacteria bacterium]